MNQLFALLFFCSLSVLPLSAADKLGNWRDDRPLLEAYHSDLAAGRIDGAILKVINWCTAQYQKEIAAKNLDEQRAKKLASDIQEAARALEFVVKHDASIRSLDDGTRTFGVFLGCFEVLFDMHPIRDGSGERYELFVRSYYEARKLSEKLIAQDARGSENREAEQDGGGQPATRPESK